MKQVLLRSDEMRAAEQRAITAGGVSGFDLMVRAGKAVADVAGTMAPHGGRILVLCGSGNNGGDGFVAAAALRQGGRDTAVACTVPLTELHGDAARAAMLWEASVEPADQVDLQAADLVVDALFGIGLSRDLTGSAAALVERINAAGCLMLAVDVPSGLDADTGQVRGAAVRATRTVTFACRRPGHLLYPGRNFCGEVEVAEIGVGIEEAGPPTLFANSPDLWSGHMPLAKPESHKYDRGHALVLSGGLPHTGAARMAARAALRIGAGLVTVASPHDALATNAAHLTAIMLRVCDDADGLTELLTDRRFNALLLGPALGVGEGTRQRVGAALAADRGTVLDADALTSFSGRASALADLTGATRRTPVVLTPHEGEFTRLFAGEGEENGTARALLEIPSKLDRALAAASFTGAVLILKGPDTVIAAPDGRAAINENGSAHLATAGSGDVLGGMVTGLIAQGMDGFEAACAAVWLHAESGTAFGPGLIAEDLPDLLPTTLRRLVGR